MQIVKSRVLKENQDDSDLRFSSIYSPNLEVDSAKLLLKKTFKTSLKAINSLIEIKIFLFNARKQMESFNLIVRLDQTPSDILGFVKLRLKENENDLFLNDVNDNLVLNVCGLDEILIGNEHKFGSYKVLIRLFNF